MDKIHDKVWQLRLAIDSLLHRPHSSSRNPLFLSHSSCSAHQHHPPGSCFGCGLSLFPQGLERTLLDPIKTAGQLATLPKSCMSLWTHLPPSALSLNDAHLCVREEAGISQSLCPGVLWADLCLDSWRPALQVSSSRLCCKS